MDYSTSQILLHLSHELSFSLVYRDVTVISAFDEDNGLIT